MAAVLDDFDLDIRIGDALGRLAVMQRETEDCSTEIACETDSGLGCGPIRSQDICPTESCHPQTHCC